MFTREHSLILPSTFRFYWHNKRHVTVHLLQSVFTSVVLVIRKQIFIRVTITVLSSIKSVVYRIAF